ncbi:TMEM165/GDT1 family protein [Haloprofundus sp. MHR1]|uniref:TMEM165/GDT1 family protein n=1 Tax=Haloprofundus sp. MHR1 TaxID=2572921 RepID=UPI0010BF5FD1|nr:TMEM165/GDT1 family protein [Haloprofundus sp. MHR1]QCJ47618.1 TMEM165/GDT1 family protein [Haloprofundus sp. MHR1]
MNWSELLVVAFVTQLAVLPGEKVQFIIAGLSTRYRPLVVVGAASAAFAGWTALEILFGSALQAALPGVALDAFTAVLFLAFAVLLFRSAPEADAGDPTRAARSDGGESNGVSRTSSRAKRSDGGESSVSSLAPELDTKLFGYDVGGRFGGFLPIFAMMVAGEFGDKTQLVTIGLAAQYGASSAIWFGEMLAIVPVSLANAYFFHKFAHAVDMRKAHFAGAALFLLFGLDVLLSVATGFSAWDVLVAAVADAVTGLA